MSRSMFKRLTLMFGLLLVSAAAAAAQDDAYTFEPSPTASPAATPPKPLPTPAPRLVKPTLYPAPPANGPATAVDDLTLLPTPSPTPVFYHQGVLVETLDGRTVYEQASDQQYNPASAIKLATALAALRTFGPRHRFTTVVWTTGTFDAQAGTVTGDLIVSGRDPSFRDEHAVLLARELNRLGVRTVTGDLIVAPKFTLNFSPSSQRSGERLYDTLDATRRPASAARAWLESRAALGDGESLQTTPSVAVMGAVYVLPVPAGARMLVTHRSSPLADVLKVLLCYSNNFMADRLGDQLGGADGLQRFLIREAGVAPSDVRLSSTSGLGVNRLSPRSMMKVYKELRAELAKHNLTPADVMPVAGVDPGTLQKRFTSDVSRASVIAKTGTLGRTDGGASALVGQMRTAGGETLLFVIFNQRGSVWRFRAQQDALVTSLQLQHGGPAAFAYTPRALSMRLSATQTAHSASSDEYEPESNQ